MSSPTVPRIALFGECMIELRGTAFGAMTQGYGGDTLNTAVYLARCGGAQAWGLSGGPELTATLKMRSFARRAVTLGGVKAAWLGYDVLPPKPPAAAE